MTSQPDLQTIAIHIFPNISQSKGNQTMKFGQSIDYNKRNIFLQSYAENEAGGLVPDLFLFFKKSLVRGESKWSAAISKYFDSPQVAIK